MREEACGGMVLMLELLAKSSPDSGVVGAEGRTRLNGVEVLWLSKGGRGGCAPLVNSRQRQAESGGWRRGGRRRGGWKRRAESGGWKRRAESGGWRRGGWRRGGWKRRAESGGRHALMVLQGWEAWSREGRVLQGWTAWSREGRVLLGWTVWSREGAGFPRVGQFGRERGQGSLGWVERGGRVLQDSTFGRDRGGWRPTNLWCRRVPAASGWRAWAQDRTLKARDGWRRTGMLKSLGSMRQGDEGEMERPAGLRRRVDVGAGWYPRGIGTGPNEDKAPARSCFFRAHSLLSAKGGGRRPTRMRATPGNEEAGLGLNDGGHPATTTAGWSTETAEDLRRP
ncbi:hypothetical protein DFP72DRAFT_1041101 [Ephemerocybe angulata]|uniref:Uncharacterized protein n=1 Tax=Ephemerocybe angulata TaxID=980116 RepID=A0A8H6MFN8_9AGAR|nr:hypothetical protein DFP72DRAFT_1041101 [Tulosesus angulatus]